MNNLKRKWTTDYTVVSNTLINCFGVNPMTRFLCIFLSAQSDNFQFNNSILCQALDCTEATLRKYMKEATDLGLIKRTRITVDGKFGSFNYELVTKHIDSSAFAELSGQLAPGPMVARKKPRNYVYLMLDKRNGFIKIGRSANPARREKTLQSEVPEITMIGAWEAPKKTESQLHRKYEGQRVRGEWFDLSESDIRSIKARLRAIQDFQP